MSRLPILALAFWSANAAGCVVQGRAAVIAEPVVVYEPDYIIVEPAHAVVVFREPPPLVLVEGNVYVVQNVGYAIYFVDGFYWYFHGGFWFHASHWDEPWLQVEVHVVPTVIVHRKHQEYVRFKGSATAHVWREPKVRPHPEPTPPEQEVEGRKTDRELARPDADGMLSPTDADRASPKKDADRASPKKDDDRASPKKDDDRAAPKKDDDRAAPKKDDDRSPRVDDKKKKKKPVIIDKKKKKAPKGVRQDAEPEPELPLPPED